jgi:hypothetical protein
MAKNNVTTKGYFIKRLRDSGFWVVREYYRYGDTDPRRWSVVVNPEDDSLFITCYDNGEWPYRGLFEFNDGGRKFPKNYHINTDSMEVIVSHLLQFKVEAKELNTIDGRQRKQKADKALQAKKDS